MTTLALNTPMNLNNFILEECRKITVIHSSEIETLKTEYEYNMKLVQEKIDDKIKILATRINNYLKKDLDSFYEALYHDRISECDFLLKNNLVIDLEYSKKKSTPIIIAATKGYFSIVKLLIDSGANINVSDKNNDSLLNIIVRQSSSNKESIEIIRQLISNGADINSKNYEGNTPLHISMLTTPYNMDIIELLIKSGSNINAQNNSIMTPLMFASIDGEADCMKLLLDMDANINIQNLWGATALYIAVQSRNIKSVKLLLEAGSDINIKTYAGKTPYDAAKNPDIVKLLTEPINVRCVYAKNSLTTNDLINIKIHSGEPDWINVKIRNNNQWCIEQISIRNLVLRIPKNFATKIEYHVLPVGTLTRMGEKTYKTQFETFVKFPMGMRVDINDQCFQLGSIYRVWQN